VSRHQLLERILEARYEVECAPRGSKQRCIDALNTLIDEARGPTNASRQELLVALHPRYLEFRKKKRREEQLKGAQNLR
jgi:hypothetical protein